ncbi:MAG: pseudouridine synthase [Aureliella sp.]
MPKKRPPSKPAKRTPAKKLPAKTSRKKGARQPTGKKSAVGSAEGGQRLNKILAAAGHGSRREVEELIVQGRVEVDREIITNLAFKADPKTAKIKVDGQLLKQQRLVYFMLNKPTGVLSTNRDPSGRIRAIDFVPGNQRVFSVGRLDKSSEGLMLLTNDGELAQKLAHPKYRVQKTYFVVVSGVMKKEDLEKLKKGVYLSEGFARIDGARIKKQRKASTELEIVLSEGKNREIRRILARAGHKVVVLRRIAIASLRLAQLPVGASRQLTSAEVRALYAITEARPKKAAKKKPSSKPKKAETPTSESSSPPAPIFDDDMDDEFISSPTTSFDFEDDDFVGDFSGSGGTGSVLGYEEDLPVGGGSSKRRSSDTKNKKTTSRRSSSRNAKTSRTSSRTAKSSSRSVSKTGRRPANSGTASRGGTSKRGSTNSKKAVRGKPASASKVRSTTKGRPASRKAAGPKKGKRPAKPNRKRR